MNVLTTLCYMKMLKEKYSEYRVCIYILAVVCIVMCCIDFSSICVKASNKKTKVVFEFMDGSKQTWINGKGKIDIGEKKIAYVYFGSYPQKEIKGKKLTQEIIGADYGENGIATVKGVKYKRISRSDMLEREKGCHYYSYEGYLCYNWSRKEYAYFKYEPIKWRVLSYTKTNIFLLSEYAVDSQHYDDYGRFWNVSDIRDWLNSNFFKNAFTTTERKYVNTTLNRKDNDLSYEYVGNERADTKNKVFYLEYSDLLNKKYGFDENPFASDEAKICTATEYARSRGVYVSEEDNGKKSCIWLTRSLGSEGPFAVAEWGSVLDFLIDPSYESNAVRPAININISSMIK